MKYNTLALVAVFFLAIACNNTPDRPDAAVQSTSPTAATNTTTLTPGSGADIGVPPTPPAEPAQNAQGVWHYTCPSGCAGGGGSAAPCGVCGTTLVHNTAYHNGGAAEKGTVANPINLEVNGDNGGATTITPPTPPAEPAQNAAGVWHYTCPSGCDGGAGSAIACAGCGTTLVHNSGYH